MMVLLTEAEYNDLIHKDRIRRPVEEFVKALQKMAIPSHDLQSAMFLVDVKGFQDIVQTLKIKLDL